MYRKEIDVSDRNYWQRIKKRQYSRRSLLQASARAGVGVTGIALIGCGGDDDDGDQPASTQAQQQTAAQVQQQGDQQAESVDEQQQQQQAAVAQAQQADDEPKRGGRIIAADLDTFETFAAITGPYAIGRGDTTEPWDSGLWDKLMQRRDSLDPEPRLAESWEQNGDATATIVTLRQGIEFHNGKPINAEAVKASYEAITAETTNTSQVRGLVNNYLESIDVIDDRTLQFNHANWPGPIIFDMFTFAPIHDADNIQAYMEMTEVNASGPFKFDFSQWEAGETWVAVRNENHYAPPLVDEIEYRTIPDSDTMALALESEELDFSASVSPEQFLRLQDLDYLSGHPSPPLGYWVVGPVQTLLGGGHPANDDPRFRRALHMAIDRERLHDEVYQGINDIVYQMWPKTSSAYDPAFDQDPYDPEAARALVEEAGLAGVEMDMFVSLGVTPDDASAEILQANFAEIGVNVTIVYQEVAEWAEDFLAGVHPGLYLAPTGFFWMEPETLPNMNFQFRLPVNAVASVGPEYTAILEGFASQPSPQERQTLFNDWNELFADGPWLLPFAAIQNGYVFNNRVKNVAVPPFGFTYKEEWWLDA